MKQIKNSFLRKKVDLSLKRQAWLKNPDSIKSVLLVTNSDKKSIKRKVEELFTSASVYHLFPREFKEDRTVGFYFSVHKTDFNLTGVLKNDKLLNLKKMPIDLLLDLSAESDLLNYFVSQTNSDLKVGDMNSSKADLYDLMLEFGTADSDNIDIIYKHINTFTQNAGEQV
jgi:Family of unknown function (DUF6913)